MSSHLEAELAEQPAALARFVDRQRPYAEEIAALFRAHDVQYILIASRGSSSNAARYAQYLLGRAHRVSVAFATPSLYTLYEQPPRLDGALVIGISQSGESPGRARGDRGGEPAGPADGRDHEQGRLAARAARATPCCQLEAGDERAVAATKTYVNSLGAIALLFAVTTGAGLAELQQIPAQLARQIEQSRESVEELGLLEGGTVVARGVNYSTAFETALKIRELSGLLFEAYSGADLMHGPVAAIGPGWPVFAIAPSGPALPAMLETLDGVAARGARLIVAADDEAVLARADVALPLLPGVPEWLSPLTAVVPGQFAALRLARLRGIDLDRPLGLSKVTLTR